MKMLYKYAQAEFPYGLLIEENQRRGRNDPEFELFDTGVFKDNRYFDVFAEYAKGSDEDIFIRITVWNRGPEAAALHLLPTLWFRNTWSWGTDLRRPLIRKATPVDGILSAELQHWQYGKRWLLAADQPELLFTENETNNERLFNGRNRSPYVKDAFHEYVIGLNKSAVNPNQTGTKMAAHYVLQLEPSQSRIIKLRLTDIEPLGGMDSDARVADTITSPAHQERSLEVPGTNDFGAGFDKLFEVRQGEADEFYASRIPQSLSEDAKNVMRQAYGGMLWSKQFYHYDVKTWLEGDPAGPAPPKNGCMEEIRIGRIYTTTTLFRCRTNGSIRGMQRGI